MGVFNIIFFGGFGMGPIIGGFLSDMMGLNFAFYSMGGLNLIALILAISLLPNTEHYNRNIVVRKSYILMLKESNLTKGLFNFRLLFAVARSIFSCFLPIFCGLQLGLSGSQIGVLLSTNMLLSSVIQIFTGRLADIFSRRALIIIGGVGDCICFLFIPLMHSFYPLLGLCMLSAVANAISPPSSAALATEEGRKYGMGASMGMFNMAMSIGMAVGPIIGGAVSSHFNVGIVFILAALAEFIGILLFTKFTSR
ncbi:MAG: MFS transporter [Candidatus Stahlbacteria bacterium]|nr:MFS transporter [Candidatus Stahlbacteria bacterium]